MKNFTHLFILMALLLVAPVARAVTITILVGDNYYSPLNATAKVGDVVKWQYVTGSSHPHPTSSDNGAWSTFVISATTPTNSLTFTTAGTYPYHCDLHGAPGLGMYGTLTVTAALPTLPAQALTVPLLVYPNPATHAAKLLVAGGPAGSAATVQLCNVLGRLVHTQEVSAADLGRELPLDVANLPAGIYFSGTLVNLTLALGGPCEGLLPDVELVARNFKQDGIARRVVKSSFGPQIVAYGGQRVTKGRCRLLIPGASLRP